jgi:non-specific serine/threonine protein kinase
MNSNSSYKTRDFECGALFQTLRTKAHLRQQDIASMVGVGVNTVQFWESGSTYPKAETLKKLLEVYLRFELFSPGQELDEAEELWEKVRQQAPRLNALFDRDWFKAQLADLARSRQLKSAQKREPAPPPVPNNLPGRLTSFVGRKKELAILSDWLRPGSTRPCVRLVTLSGAGGSGKTSLALQIAREVLVSYPQGVWLVELAPLSTASGVTQALAASLGLQEQPGSSLLDTITNYLGEKQVLVVLDNCEHLIEECAHVLDSLLRHCPKLVVLATSREGLKVSGETIFRVPSLSLPPGHSFSLRQSHQSAERSLPQIEKLIDYEAIVLFVERGKSASRSFELNEQNRAVVVELCRRLDGIPLAIELAAARLRVLSVYELNQRLADRFRLLRSGSDRTVLPRHQTLRATVEWGYELLSQAERLLFRRLSVFAGGFSLEAAEEICAFSGLEAEEILDLLHELVNKSLVLVEENENGQEGASLTDHSSGDQLRFKLLETLREYGWEQLSLAGQNEAVIVQERHLAFFTKLAEQIERGLSGIDAKTGLMQLELEHDNLRLALNWCLKGVETLNEPESETGLTELKSRINQGLRMGACLFQFWYTRNYIEEGREYLEKLRSQAARFKLEPTVDLSRVTIAIGVFNDLQGNYNQAIELYKESMKISTELGDKLRISNILNNLGIIAIRQGDYQLANDYLKQCLVLQQELGDKLSIAKALNNLGMIAFVQKDYLLAQRYAQEELDLSREIGNKMLLGKALNNLGEVARTQGDYQQARRYYAESLAIKCELGDKREVAEALTGYYKILLSEAEQASFSLSSKLEQVCRLVGAATGLFAAIKSKFSDSQDSFNQKTIETLRQKMGEDAFNRAFEAGKAMSLEEAVVYTLAEAEESISN